MRKAAKKLAHEVVGGEPYEYYPVGRYGERSIDAGRIGDRYENGNTRHAD
jgi:hypothetical protein